MHRLPASLPLALLCAGLLSCAPLAERSATFAAPQIHTQMPHADAPELARVRPGPDRATLFNRMGQAHRLHGDLDAARAAFEQACLHDPLQAHSWQMLGETLTALGHEERARRSLRQAAALRHHDVRADFAATGGTSDVAAIGKALAAPPASAPSDWPRSWIEQGVDGMLVLRRDPGIEQVISRSTSRLEIRNGNGVTGMARALSRRIDEPGMQVTRLSNDPGFAVRQTRIEYTAPHLDAAQRLAERLGDVQLRPTGANMRADLRLVLGRDLVHHGTALRLAPGVDSRLSQR